MFISLKLVSVVMFSTFLVCNGLGVGDLTNTLSINATNIDSFKNCTKINGNIAIIHTSIYG